MTPITIFSLAPSTFEPEKTAGATRAPMLAAADFLRKARLPTFFQVVMGILAC
jgi:hypothetical protein